MTTLPRRARTVMPVRPASLARRRRPAARAKRTVQVAPVPTTQVTGALGLRCPRGRAVPRRVTVAGPVTVGLGVGVGVVPGAAVAATVAAAVPPPPPPAAA